VEPRARAVPAEPVVRAEAVARAPTESERVARRVAPLEPVERVERAAPPRPRPPLVGLAAWAEVVAPRGPVEPAGSRVPVAQVARERAAVTVAQGETRMVAPMAPAVPEAAHRTVVPEVRVAPAIC